jgi:uncharacterized protein YdbL (DUF1318 family)
MKSITLDGKTYELDKINPQGQEIARQAGVASDLVRKLEARLAIARTAQGQYAENLRQNLKDANEL